MTVDQQFYDLTGPRARRNSRIASAATFVVLVLVAAVIVRRLAAQGQFAMHLWSPLLNPDDPLFSEFWLFLGRGLSHTIVAAVVTMVLSLFTATAMAMVRLYANRFFRWIIVAAVEVLRGTPAIVLIFAVAVVLPRYGIRLPDFWYVVIALVAHSVALLMEIIRAGISSLPRGQWDAAYAIGLSHAQALRIIVLPQAFRIMSPAIIAQLIVTLKNTSLGFVVGFSDLLHNGEIAIQNLDNPIQVYAVVAAIFIIINYGLSILAARLGKL